MSNPFSDADVISSYTTEQAIEDGVLVHLYPDKYPYLLLTAAVHTAIKEKIEPIQLGRGMKRTLDQAVIPLMMDAARIVQRSIAADGLAESLWTKGLEGNVTGKELWMALNDLGGLTIMFPEDN